MIKPNELECVNCNIILEDPEIFIKTYGNKFNCQKCGKPLTKIT